MNLHRLNQGFTMIEMVITIVVMGIIAGVAAILLAGGVDAYLTGERVMTNAPAARLAMDRTLLELRQACDGGISASDTRIDFFAPAPDCINSPAAHAIRLLNTNLELQLVADGTWYPLARNVAPIADGSPVFALSSDSVSGCQFITIQFRVTNDDNDALPVRSAVFLQSQTCVPPSP